MLEDDGVEAPSEDTQPPEAKDSEPDGAEEKEPELEEDEGRKKGEAGAAEGGAAQKPTP